MMSEPLAKKGFLNLVWLRDFILVLILSAVGLKIALTDFSVDLSGFSFTDLLALLMSLFSIWLSAMFYFKASDNSNKFYDDTYKFTKDMSEMLGRIEVGFGEKLSNLHEGYLGLRNTVDRFPHQTAEDKAAVKVGKEMISKKEKEREDLIDNLISRAQLAEDDKQLFIKELAEKNSALEQAKRELDELDAKLTIDMEKQSDLATHIAYRLDSNFPKKTFNLKSVEIAIEAIEDDLHPAALFDLDSLREGEDNKIPVALRSKILSALRTIRSIPKP